MIEWEQWQTKPATVRMVRFTGFEGGGNGYELLDDLHRLRVSADRYDDVLRIFTREREESAAVVGDWIVIGTRGEVYPIAPDVQGDKYQRPAQ